MGRRRTIIAAGFTLVAILAIGLRWYHFNEFPPGLWFDEAHHLNGAQALALGLTPPRIYYPVKTGEPAIYWLTALAIRLGADHLAPRWVAAISSLFGVGLIYVVSYDVLRRRYAFAGAVSLWPMAVLATNYFYLFNSRMGWEPVLVTVLSILTIWLFWRGLMTGRVIDFFWSGVFLGASQYTGVIARSLPIVLLLLTLLWLAATRSTFTARSRKGGDAGGVNGTYYGMRLRGLLVSAGAAAVVYLPLARHFIGNPGLFAQRLETSASADQWLGNMSRTLGGFVWLEEQTLHRLANRPVFDWPIATLLIIGTCIALWRWRNPVYSIWLAWIVGFLPGAMLSAPAPVFYRYLPTIPAAAVLSGVAIAEGWLWAQRRSRVWQAGLLTIACGALAVSIFLNGRDYFQRWPASTDLYSVMDEGKWAAAEALLSAGEDATIFVTMPANIDPTVSYAILTRGEAVRPFDGQRCVVFRDPAVKSLRYVVITGYESQTLPYLRQLFPGGSARIDPVFGENEPYYVDYYVPADSSVQIQGLLPDPITFDGIVLRGMQVPAEEVRPAEPLPVTLTWEANGPVPQNLTAFVHLLSRSPDDPTPLKAQHDGIPCAGGYPTTHWLAGEYVVDNHVVTLPPDIPPGQYLLSIGLYETDSLQSIAPAGENLTALYGEAIVLEITILSPE